MFLALISHIKFVGPFKSCIYFCIVSPVCLRYTMPSFIHLKVRSIQISLPFSVRYLRNNNLQNEAAKVKHESNKNTEYRSVNIILI